VAMSRGNLNRLEDLTVVYPWTEDMVKGEGGRPAVRKLNRITNERTSGKQKAALRRSGDGR
jgi:hypothetical protein